MARSLLASLLLVACSGTAQPAQGPPQRSPMLGIAEAMQRRGEDRTRRTECVTDRVYGDRYRTRCEERR